VIQEKDGDLMIKNWTELTKPTRLEADEKTLTSTYGKFYGEPFERGYGQTVGNALRRIMLSSLMGAAIISVRIKGVLHEFSTIQGVTEDVTDIILNLKQVRLKLNEVERDTLKLGELDMELTVKMGRGYVPGERNKEEEAPVDTIFLDAVFSPIQKVNFNITNARVGQRTDFDRLVFEIWSDGSVKPEDGLAFGAKILQDQLNIFINFEEEMQHPETRTDSTAAALNENLFRSVDELEFSVRSQNCLQSADIKYIGELVQKTEQEMLKTKNFGRKSLNEIKEILREMGLEIGMKLDNFPSREELDSRRQAKHKETA
jgi:DNA-directed RNA polymerase subunit alpha